ncbi:diguanylate cyclase domain-containing protein [uncultured Tissierella sp.]|uniref:diguanylate cyclase domain-containing protein n=1 Tax=uncultured Tissierella sp. TaxID=448160 RepID=UPI0028047199|nr:HD domain-containing phosphohydrolase [uncultured Tissierella sp.]MDU5081123.1 diguanylate cyclase [Bacillota bacterium]
MFTIEDFQMMLDSTPVGYVYHELIYDDKYIPIDLKILDFNPSYLEIIGIKNIEIQDKYILELFPSIRNEIPQLFELVTDAILHNRHTLNSVYIPSFNKWLKIHLFSPKKNFFIAQFIDLTKEKKLEASLIQKSNELEELINSISDLVIAINFNGSIIKVNQAWERVLGYNINELISHQFMSFLHPEDLEFIYESFNNGIIFDPNYILRTRVLKKSGEWLYLEWKLSFYEDIAYAVGRNVTEIIEKEEQIIYLSYHDKLTGLYNRAFFEEELKRLDNNRHLPLSIIMGDVNGLKIINDVFGHLAGDRMLQSIAEILKVSCRRGDIIARWGGDEFIILLPNTSSSITEEITDRIYSNCKDRELDMQYANISLGYAVKDHNDMDIMKVLVEAENNMYKNKIIDGKKVRDIIISSMIQYLFDGNYEIKYHIDRVKNYSLALANRLNLSNSDRNKLILLAEVHDIGKISISKEILEKPRELDELEWNEIRKHPEIGYRIAKSIPELADIAELILYHHERWDGKGYPHELKGEEIPLLSRIFSVVDVYDAITQNKPHRKAMCLDEAIDFLLENKGIQFDPYIVDSFIKILLQY